MRTTPSQFSFMVAHSARPFWGETLARRLSNCPVDFHWPQSGDEAVDVIAGRAIHVAIVDDSLPRSGGLDAVRRLRQSGLDSPAVLVSIDPDRRLMMDAIQLDVYSVVKVAPDHDYLTPVVMRLVRQFYHVDWPDPDYGDVNRVWRN